MIDFSNVKELYVNNQEVKEFKAGDTVLWKRNSFEDYQRVDYIESTGTQYIITDYKIKSNTRLEIGFTAEAMSNNWNMIVGARTSYNSTDCFNLYSNAGNKLAYGIGGVWNDYYLPYTAPERFDCVLDRTGITVNGVKTERNTNLTNGLYNVYLFAVNQKNSVTESKSNIKLYYCRFYEDDELVMEFIPCYRKSNNEIGLYETRNNVFYTNRGSGTFLKGDDLNYQRVDYIKSTGTQYINTRVLASQNISFEISCIPHNDCSERIYGCIFGGRYMSGISDFQLTTYSPRGYNKGVVRLGPNNTDNMYLAHLEKDVEAHIEYKNNHYYVNNIDYGEYTPSSFSSPHEIYLFALNQQNSPTQFGNVTLRYFRIWDNDVLIRDFVPCYRISDGEIGLYDLVNEEFYTNDGTGTFEKGNNI